MKIFQTIENDMRYGGYIRDRGAFNTIQIWTIFRSILFVIMQIMYLIHVANAPAEYLDSIFMTAAGILIFISHLSVCLKTAVIFDLIDGLEEPINASEYPFWKY